MTTARTQIAALGLLASVLVGIALDEGFIGRAAPPVPGDVPTYGFGTTTHADGTPVKLGETTTPTRALVDLLRDAGRAEQAVKRCANVPMHPWEYSAFVGLTYNVGEGAFCSSSIPSKLQRGDYAAACQTILDFNKFRDCTQPKVWNAKKQRWECPLVELRGLTLRRQREYRLCTGAPAP